MERAKPQGLKPGRYSRVYKGKSYRLIVETDGTCRSKVHGKVFTSATEAAEAIAKRPTSGPYFWDENRRHLLISRHLKNIKMPIRMAMAMAKNRKQVVAA